MEKRHRIKEAVIPFAGILLLAGDDKHILARPRFAKAGTMYVRDVVQPLLRGWQEAQAGDVLALPPDRELSPRRSGSRSLFRDS